MDDTIQEAVRIFNQGGIVIYPTDTAFGIGCRIDDKEAVGRLFRIRKRPKTQAVPVLVSNIEMVQEYVVSITSDIKEALIEKYWPGALTIVLTCKTEKVPELVRGGGQTLGVRMPNHKSILQIIEQVGFLILGPSANFHGERTPYRFEDLDPELVEQVDFVLEGECSLKQSSTVVDCTIKPWRILREGAVKLKME